MVFGKRHQGYSGSAYGKAQADLENLRKIANEVAASGKFSPEVAAAPKKVKE